MKDQFGNNREEGGNFTQFSQLEYDNPSVDVAERRGQQGASGIQAGTKNG